MNRIFIFLLGSMVLFSCKKDLPIESTERRSNPNQFYHTCANSWNETIPSNGLAAEVDVKKLSLGSGVTKSYWIAFYYNVLVNGVSERRWVQWGYFVDKFTGRKPDQAFFLYRFPNGQGGQSTPTIIYSGLNVPLEYNTRVRFEIKNIEGTNFWAFSRNGQEVFRADLETNEAVGVFEACTESRGDASFSPALTTYYLETLKSGQWVKVKTGISDTFSWGIQGQTTIPEFEPSKFIMGGKTKLPTFPAWLWGKPNY